MNDLRGLLFLVLFGLPLKATANLECRTNFICINTTHFHICGDYGDGKLRAFESLTFSCPPHMMCDETSVNECHFPVITTTTQISVISTDNEKMSTMTLPKIMTGATSKTTTYTNAVAQKRINEDNRDTTAFLNNDTMTETLVFTTVHPYNFINPDNLINTSTLKAAITDGNKSIDKGNTTDSLTSSTDPSIDTSVYTTYFLNATSLFKPVITTDAYMIEETIQRNKSNAAFLSKPGARKSTETAVFATNSTMNYDSGNTIDVNTTEENKRTDKSITADFLKSTTDTLIDTNLFTSTNTFTATMHFNSSNTMDVNMTDESISTDKSETRDLIDTSLEKPILMTTYLIDTIELHNLVKITTVNTTDDSLLIDNNNTATSQKPVTTTATEDTILTTTYPFNSTAHYDPINTTDVSTIKENKRIDKINTTARPKVTTVTSTENTLHTVNDYIFLKVYNSNRTQMSTTEQNVLYDKTVTTDFTKIPTESSTAFMLSYMFNSTTLNEFHLSTLQNMNDAESVLRDKSNSELSTETSTANIIFNNNNLYNSTKIYDSANTTEVSIINESLDIDVSKTIAFQNPMTDTPIKRRISNSVNTQNKSKESSCCTYKTTAVHEATTDIPTKKSGLATNDFTFINLYDSVTNPHIIVTEENHAGTTAFETSTTESSIEKNNSENSYSNITDAVTTEGSKDIKKSITIALSKEKTDVLAHINTYTDINTYVVDQTKSVNKTIEKSIKTDRITENSLISTSTDTNYTGKVISTTESILTHSIAMNFSTIQKVFTMENNKTNVLSIETDNRKLNMASKESNFSNTQRNNSMNLKRATERETYLENTTTLHAIDNKLNDEFDQNNSSRGFSEIDTSIIFNSHKQKKYNPISIDIHFKSNETEIFKSSLTEKLNISIDIYHENNTLLKNTSLELTITSNVPNEIQSIENVTNTINQGESQTLQGLVMNTSHQMTEINNIVHVQEFVNNTTGLNTSLFNVDTIKEKIGDTNSSADVIVSNDNSKMHDADVTEKYTDNISNNRDNFNTTYMHPLSPLTDIKPLNSKVDKNNVDESVKFSNITYTFVTENAKSKDDTVVFNTSKATETFLKKETANVDKILANNDANYTKDCITNLLQVKERNSTLIQHNTTKTTGSRYKDTDFVRLSLVADNNTYGETTQEDSGTANSINHKEPKNNLYMARKNSSDTTQIQNNTNKATFFNSSSFEKPNKNLSETLNNTSLMDDESTSAITLKNNQHKLNSLHIQNIIDVVLYTSEVQNVTAERHAVDISKLKSNENGIDSKVKPLTNLTEALQKSIFQGDNINKTINITKRDHANQVTTEPRSDKKSYTLEHSQSTVKVNSSLNPFSFNNESFPQNVSEKPVVINNKGIQLPKRDIIDFECVTEGRFSDVLRDNYYYICVKNNSGSGFTRFKLRCQNGYHVNKSTVKCELNEGNTEQLLVLSTVTRTTDSDITKQIKYLKDNGNNLDIKHTNESQIGEPLFNLKTVQNDTENSFSITEKSVKIINDVTSYIMEVEQETSTTAEKNNTLPKVDVTINDDESDEVEISEEQTKINVSLGLNTKSFKIERNIEPISVKPVPTQEVFNNVEIFKNNKDSEVKLEMSVLQDFKTLQSSTSTPKTSVTVAIAKPRTTSTSNMQHKIDIMLETTTSKIQGVEATTSNVGNETRFICPKLSGRYAENNDCRTFYICIGQNNPVVKICPTGTVFSDFRKQCTKNLSHCIRNNEFECTSEGRFRDIFTDNYYYICVKDKNHYVRFKLRCEKGYHINEYTLKCERNGENSEQSSVSQDSIASSEKGTVKIKKEQKRSAERHGAKRSARHGSFRCIEEGRFPDPDNCRKYYVCYKKHSRLRKKRKRCKKDEIFQKDKYRCVSAESNGCE